MREYGVGGYFKLDAASKAAPACRLADRTRELEMLERIDLTVRELRTLILALSPPERPAKPW